VEQGRAFGAHRDHFRELLPSAKPGCANGILHLTEGVTVRVCRLLEEAAVQAIATGGERIELETLNEEVVTAKLVSISDRRTRRMAA
jgi:hypothetical protein